MSSTFHEATQISNRIDWLPTTNSLHMKIGTSELENRMHLSNSYRRFERLERYNQQKIDLTVKKTRFHC